MKKYLDKIESER